MNDILAQAFYAELEKIAAPMTQAGYYEKKRRIATKGFHLPVGTRAKFMREYMAERGEDKPRVARAGVAGAGVGAGLGALGAEGAAFHRALRGGKVPSRSKTLLAALAGAAALGGVSGGVSEAKRRAAGKAVHDPSKILASLEKTRTPRRLKKEYKLWAARQAAAKGKLPSKGRFQFTSKSLNVGKK